MNKMAVVLGAAAIATLAGCKDPEYARIPVNPENGAKSVETEPVAEPAAEPSEIKAEEVKAEPAKCKCAPGTKHDQPCECGAPDCQCIVEAKAVEPEYTTYIVQRGDYLAKISKKFNIRVDAIKKLNGMKGDSVRLGQKLKLPGKVEVGEQKVPEGAIKSAPVRKPYESYKGEVRDYVVKSGDSLGKIAYANGMNIRQLKELNGLKKDTVYIGQKLKVAAGGKAASAAAAKKPAVTTKPVGAAKVVAPAAADKPVEADKGEAKPVEPAKEAPVAAATPGDEEVKAPAVKVDEPKVEGAATDYVVQDGDDLPNIAIEFQVPVARLRELNNLGEGDEVKAGQVLKIPAAQ